MAISDDALFVYILKLHVILCVCVYCLLYIIVLINTFQVCVFVFICRFLLFFFSNVIYYVLRSKHYISLLFSKCNVQNSHS